MPPLKELLSKPMSRKEFLRLFGVAILSLFGAKNFIQYVFNANKQSSSESTSKADRGFGSRSFGN